MLIFLEILNIVNHRRKKTVSFLVPRRNAASVLFIISLIPSNYQINLRRSTFIRVIDSTCHRARPTWKEKKSRLKRLRASRGDDYHCKIKLPPITHAISIKPSPGTYPDDASRMITASRSESGSVRVFNDVTRRCKNRMLSPATRF